MTVEHRILVGIDDLKAITFECLKCKARITLLPNDKLGVPDSCSACSAVWKASSPSSNVTVSAPAAITFVDAIKRLVLLAAEPQAAFKILLEFDEPS